MIRKTTWATLAASLVLVLASGCAVSRGQESVGAYIDDAGITTSFDFPGLMDGGYGYLPNDRRHSLKVFGAYKFSDEWTVGANLLVHLDVEGAELVNAGVLEDDEDIKSVRPRLRAMLDGEVMMLRSPLPIVTLWGEAGVMIYNDAYSVFAGARHPQILGSDVREGWPEVADFNDDGDLDVATANAASNNVSFLPGNGNGTLGAVSRFVAGLRAAGGQPGPLRGAARGGGAGLP